jgi:hypothetical protein
LDLFYCLFYKQVAPLELFGYVLLSGRSSGAFWICIICLFYKQVAPPELFGYVLFIFSTNRSLLRSFLDLYYLSFLQTGRSSGAFWICFIYLFYKQVTPLELFGFVLLSLLQTGRSSGAFWICIICLFYKQVAPPELFGFVLLSFLQTGRSSGAFWICFIVFSTNRSLLRSFLAPEGPFVCRKELYKSKD